MFESCYELHEAFSLLLQRTDKLALVTGELWPSERVLATEVNAVEPLAGETTMESVEHMGSYVWQMAQERVAQLRKEQGLPEEVPVKSTVEDEAKLLDQIPEEGEEEEEEEEAEAEAKGDGEREEGLEGEGGQEK